MIGVKIKNKIKELLGICVDELEETQGLNSGIKEEQKSVGFSFLGCTFNEWLAISLIASTFLLYSISYYRIQRVYEKVEHEYQLKEEYVVSSSPLAIYTIQAGDEVAIDVGGGYTLTETVQEVGANELILVNEAGETQTFFKHMIKGKVVKNPMSILFHFLIKLIN